MFKHILVPTDGSALSKKAVLHAISFAKDTRASIIGFHAMPSFPLYYGEEAVINPTSPADFAKDMETRAKKILGFVANHCQEAGVSCTTQSLIRDTPSEAINNAAKKNDCDLLCMASHGLRGLSGLLLGSETNKVLTHSKIPVLVYR